MSIPGKRWLGVLGLGLCLLSGILSGCRQREAAIRSPLQGVYDGYAYTSPGGLFTVFLKSWAALDTLSDVKEKANDYCGVVFQDTPGNSYRIVAAAISPEIQPEAYIDDLVNKARQRLGNRVMKARTADNIPYMAIALQQKEKKSDLGVGFADVVFIKGNTKFELKLKTRFFKKPADAAAEADQAFHEVWRRTSFRGHPLQLPELTGSIDPRVPVVVMALKQIAESMQLAYQLEQNKKTIVRLARSGTLGEMRLSFGIRSQGNELFVTETMECKLSDKAQADKMLAVIYKLFLEKMTLEKLTINRDRVLDQELLPSSTPRQP